MSEITAKVIEDSIHDGSRLTTLQLRYPRFIHSEFMTHRVFSRNASSSRAIPVAKMIEQVRTDYAHPIHWGKNQAGMQAKEELEQPSRIRVQSLWCEAANKAADFAELMLAENAHKQIANRIMEPFQWISVIATATEWDNFFLLRDHEDAQPEIQQLARVMKRAMNESTPRELVKGEWHLPYVDDKHHADALEMSAARCARVSYLTHEGKKPTIAEDYKLYQRLVGSNPKHSSPIEHQATPGETGKFYNNFKGWKQLRWFHENT